MYFFTLYRWPGAVMPVDMGNSGWAGAGTLGPVYCSTFPTPPVGGGQVIKGFGDRKGKGYRYLIGRVCGCAIRGHGF